MGGIQEATFLPTFTIGSLTATKSSIRRSNLMARFKLFIEYEGTRYSGWQTQKNARTVQGELTSAIGSVLNDAEFELYGAGRTDAGVHALQQVAHLDAKTMLAPEILRRKINDELPPDIHVVEIVKASSKFHARHDALSRSYVYQISRRRTAFGKRLVWWIKDQLELDQMKAAAALFVGLKDFQSFTADDQEEKSTKVQIEEIKIEEHGDLILLRFVGSHFLWKMVRQIVGVIAEVGRGKLTLEQARSYLERKSNEPATLTAPPSGLFLERVYYEGDKKLGRLEPLMTIASDRNP
jgi:tRNA pseudouridine38-40 synthase